MGRSGIEGLRHRDLRHGRRGRLALRPAADAGADSAPDGKGKAVEFDPLFIALRGGLALDIRSLHENRHRLSPSPLMVVVSALDHSAEIVGEVTGRGIQPDTSLCDLSPL